jgi:hypothetical protein
MNFWSNGCGELFKHLNMLCLLLLSRVRSSECNISILIVIPLNVSIGMSQTFWNTSTARIKTSIRIWHRCYVIMLAIVIAVARIHITSAVAMISNEYILSALQKITKLTSSSFFRDNCYRHSTYSDNSDDTFRSS